MSTTTVQNTAVDPTGTPYAQAWVHISLITAVSGGAGYTGTGDIISTASVQTDATGHWTANLVPNVQITPANTYYQVVEGQAVSNVVVPASGGPYLLGSILATPPPTPAAPGITGVQVATGGAIAGTRPEINLVAGTNISYTAADNPGQNRVDVTVNAAGAAVDTIAADFQPIGVAAAGAVGKVADAGHIHPTQPWQFNVKAYGAKGDGVAVHDGAMTSGQNTVACASSTPFSGSLNKSVYVRNALVSGQSAGVGTVTGVTDSGHATVSFSATQAISNTIVVIATDDSAAFKAAEAAATAYAQNNPFGFAQIVVPPGIYGIAGSLVTGGTTLGNAQIPLHIVAGANNKATVSMECFEGVPAYSGAHWQQLVFQATGATLFSFGVFSSQANQGNSLTANGNPSVIGGPAQPGGYGTSTLVFSNMHFVMRNINIVTPLSASGWNYCGADLSGLAAATVEDTNIGTAGTYAAGDYNSPNTFSGGYSKALLMPANGNNDICSIKRLSVWGGYTWGLFATEHTVMTGGCRILYCWSGLAPVGAYFNSVGALHGIIADQISMEGNQNLVYVVGSGQSGIGPDLTIDQLDTETATPYFVDDGNGGIAALLGTVRLTGQYTIANITIGVTGLKLISGQQKPGYVAAPNYTLGTAFQNPWWHPVALHMNGGTVTAVDTGQTFGGAVAPTMVNVLTQASGALPQMTLEVPSGGWVKITGTVKPTMVPILD